MHVYLETERLVLRRFTHDDLDALTALDGDPVVMRYINGGRPTPREEMRDDYLPHWLAYYERGDRYGFWAAIEKATGAFLGWFHLRPLPEDPPDEPELGYRLRTSASGRGHATEGSRALVRKAFEELGARRVHASTMVVNVASWRVMEKAGLRCVRIFRQDWPDRIEGEEHGDVEYALTRDEWEAGRGAVRAAPVSGPALVATPIDWDRTGDGELPYRATFRGHTCLVRVNDFPAEPLYSLICEGEVLVDLEDWPVAWTKPGLLGT